VSVSKLLLSDVAAERMLRDARAVAVALCESPNPPCAVCVERSFEVVSALVVCCGWVVPS
jgi:hypothetical protein